MSSPLATTLLAARQAQSDTSELLWRYASIPELRFVGVAPSPTLLSELLMMHDGNNSSSIIAGLVPDAQMCAAMATNPSALVRLGAVCNPLVTLATLQILATDADPNVSKMATHFVSSITSLTATAKDLSLELTSRILAVTELVSTVRVESVKEIYAFDKDLLVAGLTHVGNIIFASSTYGGDSDEDVYYDDDSEESPGSQAAALVQHFVVKSREDFFMRLEVFCPELVDELKYALINSDLGIITSDIVLWAHDQPEVGQVLLGSLADTPKFTKRCVKPAIALLREFGYMKPLRTPEFKKWWTNLESMVDILEPEELGAILFSSTDTVSPETMLLILNHASPSVIANFFCGLTPRKPETGEITHIINSIDAVRRLELGTAVKTVLDAADEGSNSISKLPWIGELILLFSKTALPTLDLRSVQELHDSVCSYMDKNLGGWEFLLVLSKEWNSTLIDLLETSVAV
jgi:hypothetical protein